jgi:hypothetical protein
MRGFGLMTNLANGNLAKSWNTFRMSSGAIGAAARRPPIPHPGGNDPAVFSRPGKKRRHTIGNKN